VRHDGVNLPKVLLNGKQVTPVVPDFWICLRAWCSRGTLELNQFYWSLLAMFLVVYSLISFSSIRRSSQTVLDFFSVAKKQLQAVSHERHHLQLLVFNAREICVSFSKPKDQSFHKKSLIHVAVRGQTGSSRVGWLLPLNRGTPVAIIPTTHFS
jgi:hypothetical protein